jgi:hypothetical protein
MILTELGKICTAQDLTSNSTTDSENIIRFTALDWGMITDVWWVVDTETVATGDANDTYQFQLVLSTYSGSTLQGTSVEVLSRTVTAYTAWSLAGAGRRILSCNVGKMLNDILGTGLSDYPYLGMISYISDGATVSINAALSPYEPRTIPHSQAIVSNVGVPTHAS